MAAGAAPSRHRRASPLPPLPPPPVGAVGAGAGAGTPPPKKGGSSGVGEVGWGRRGVGWGLGGGRGSEREWRVGPWEGWGGVEGVEGAWRHGTARACAAPQRTARHRTAAAHTSPQSRQVTARRRPRSDRARLFAAEALPAGLGRQANRRSPGRPAGSAREGCAVYTG